MKHFIFKRLSSLFLAVLLIVSVVPGISLPAIAADETMDNEEGLVVVTSENENAVAKIGDTEYEDFATAVAAVEKGTTATPTTITLLKDLSISSLMIGHQYTQNITVDLGGHNAAAHAGGELLSLNSLLRLAHLLLHLSNLLLQLSLSGCAGNLSVGKSTACTITHGNFSFTFYLISMLSN